MQTMLEAIEPKVITDVNQEFFKDFTRDEVELALKHMEPLKALGPDGLPSIFF